MTLLKPPIEPIPSRVGQLTTWLPRIAVALAFLGVGSSKFSDPSWVRLFDQIGFGQWLRYATGLMQMIGAVLALIPMTALAGIVLIASTMLGATLAWLTVLHAPQNAPIPLALFGMLVAIGVGEYNRTRTD